MLRPIDALVLSVSCVAIFVSLQRRGLVEAEITWKHPLDMGL